MASNSNYFIPDNLAGQSTAQRYAEYRARIDRDTFARRRGEIIDVKANSVDVEQDAARSSRPVAPVVQESSADRSARRSARRPQKDAEANGGKTPLSYAAPSANGEIELKTAPQLRGMLIDLMA